MNGCSGEGESSAFDEENAQSKVRISLSGWIDRR